MPLAALFVGLCRWKTETRRWVWERGFGGWVCVSEGGGVRERERVCVCVCVRACM